MAAMQISLMELAVVGLLSTWWMKLGSKFAFRSMPIASGLHRVAVPRDVPSKRSSTLMLFCVVDAFVTVKKNSAKWFDVG